MEKEKEKEKEKEVYEEPRVEVLGTLSEITGSIGAKAGDAPLGSPGL